MKKTKIPASVFFLLLIAVLLPVGAYLLWNFGNVLPKVGSVTDHATVYSYDVGAYSLYRYEICSDTDVLVRSDLDTVPPYLWQDGDRVFLLEHDDSGTYQSCFDLTTGEEQSDDTAYAFLDPFSHIEKIKTVPVDTGCDYAKVYDLSADGAPCWYWEALDSKHSSDWLWCGQSDTVPEVRSDEGGYTIFFTEEGLPKCQEFDLVDDSSSHDYALFEDGTIYVEQAIGSMPKMSEFTGTFREDGFVNTEPAEIADCNAAYLRAANEVTIPYDLVTFCGDVDLTEMRIGHWAVTFGQKDDPDGASQTVFMDGDGVTYLILTASD